MTKDQSVNAGSEDAAGAGAATAYLILMMAPLFWGGNTIAGKLAVGHIDPSMLNLLRFIGAVLVTLPLAWPHLRRDWPVVRSRLWLLLALGAAGYSIFNLLLYHAPLYTTAVNISMEQSVIPMLVMIGSFLLFGVRARLLQIVGVALTIAGVAVVATNGDLARLATLAMNRGDVLVLLAAVIYAGYSLALRYRPPSHWLTFLAVTLIGALIVAIVFQALFGGGYADFGAKVSAISPRGWAVVAYVAVFPAIVAQLCFAYSVGRVGPNRASLFINLIPVFGTLGSVAILGEAIEPYHVAAGFLIVCGIALAEWAARVRPAPSSPA